MTTAPQEDKLDRVEQRIQTLELELQTAQTLREGLREDLLAHRALTAPIRSLPLEVLSDIFSFLCTGITIRYVEDQV